MAVVSTLPTPGTTYTRSVMIATLKNKETACLGSAILAAVGTGYFESVKKATEMIQLDRVYESAGIDYSECYRRYEYYDKLLNVTKN